MLEYKWTQPWELDSSQGSLGQELAEAGHVAGGRKMAGKGAMGVRMEGREGKSTES